ncbi:branched-chain amino acid ABC transporter permease [Acidovorax soli]|uniref:Branched-chain amino acid transport system permease protein n=1 Tax=Acidovorax soli TaxID=592050 RepID=A0A1H4FD19_9BURK|nr:branched-chain amino acid ABC transporter permease [Acidovorax soli]SEA95233.1 branched-chain amino acid transport system permease protein [Acidovorax soli]
MQFIQAIIDGILLGGVYGVIATGLSLVFGVLGIVNFAQAEFLMVGMYAAFFAWRLLGLDPMLGAFFSLLVGFGLGYLAQRYLVSRVMKAPASSQIFLTVGLMIVIENAALLVFGSDYQSVQTPYQTASITLGPLFVSAPYALAFGMSLLVSAALWWFLTHTWMGRSIRATAQNSMAATLMGVATKHTYAVAFGIGTGLTAFGGGVILPYLTVSPTIGQSFAVLMFTVVVLGGLGSVVGALVGGIVVGVIQSVSGLLFPIQLQNLVLFVVFIAVLAFRPQGLISSGFKKR